MSTYNFADLPGELRMSLRGALEREGFIVEGYHESGVQVICPREYTLECEQRLARCGLLPVDGSAHYFPMRSGMSEQYRESHGHPDVFYGTGSRSGFERFKTFRFAPEVTEGL